MVILLLITGIRNGELLDPAPSDIEWSEEDGCGLLTVRHGKSDKFRAADLPKIAWLAVQRPFDRQTADESDGLGICSEKPGRSRAGAETGADVTE